MSFDWDKYMGLSRKARRKYLSRQLNRLHSHMSTKWDGKEWVKVVDPKCKACRAERMARR